MSFARIEPLPSLELLSFSRDAAWTIISPPHTTLASLMQCDCKHERSCDGSGTRDDEGHEQCNFPIPRPRRPSPKRVHPYPTNSPGTAPPAAAPLRCPRRRSA